MSIIILILIGIIVIGIIAFLVKSFIKVALIVGLIYLLFHIGFIWGGDEIKEKLHLDKWLSEENSQKVEGNYKAFSDKREALAVVDTTKLKTTIEIQLQNALLEASNDVKSIDKEKLLNDLSKSLEKYDVETIKQVLKNMSDTLKSYQLTPEEIEASIKQ